MATKSVEWRQLRAAENYRDFLRAYLIERGLSASDLARSAGFSRGFPGDVMSGKRKLTAKSCYAFEEAMKLPRPAKKLFRLLVAVAAPREFPEVENKVALAQIKELRAKSWSKAQTVKAETSSNAVAMFREANLMTVFAAAGAPHQGASFAEIEARTRLTDREIITALEKLEQLELIRRNDDRFEPQDLHLFLQAANRQKILIEAVKRAAQLTSKRVEAAGASDSEFFFSSSLCVLESRLPELKKALRETVLRFVDESISDDGDRVVHLLTALHL